MTDDRTDVRVHSYDGYRVVTVRAGKPKHIRVVPPAGEAYAFERTDYPVEVQVSVSPTGRSVQVFVGSEKVYPS